MRTSLGSFDLLWLKITDQNRKHDHPRICVGDQRYSLDASNNFL